DALPIFDVDTHLELPRVRHHRDVPRRAGNGTHRVARQCLAAADVDGDRCTANVGRCEVDRRSQAATVDFATSNVRGAPIAVYVGGGKALSCYPMGPVAGTAWNITVMSYAGQLQMGVHIEDRKSV